MHMNSAPHLLNEDRPEFERILDEALRTAPDRPDLAAVGQRLNPEQLRTMALNATALITAAAAAEYQNYVKVRSDLRASPRPVRPLREGGSAAESGGGAIGLAATVGEVAETTGAACHSRRRGARPRARRDGCRDLPARRLHPEDARSGTGVRPDPVDGRLGVRRAHGGGDSCRRRGPAAHRSAQRRDVLASGAHNESNEEVDRAREAWCLVLLERGILPFLREALAEPPCGARQPRGRPRNRGPHAASRVQQARVQQPGHRQRLPCGPAPDVLEPGLHEPRLRRPGPQAGLGAARTRSRNTLSTGRERRPVDSARRPRERG